MILEPRISRADKASRRDPIPTPAFPFIGQELDKRGGEPALRRPMDERVEHLEAKVERWRYRVKDAEERKTYDEVFDRRTLLAFQRLINEGTLETLDYPVSTGKEGNVFRATSAKGPRAVKVYRVSTATFRTIGRYIEGDPRFPRLGGNRRKLIYAWAAKEFKNLSRMAQAGVHVPKPIRCLENILVMRYVGSAKRAAPTLRQVVVEDPTRLLDLLLADLQGIHRASLVHGDLSEYNILFWRRRPYIIDVGQAVPYDHPRAEDWFRRDMENMARYFRHLGVDGDPETLTAQVRGE